LRKAFLLSLLLITMCGWKVEQTGGMSFIARYVLEKDFKSIRLGMSATQVTAAIGVPDVKIRNPLETWEYSVWRGETPSMLRMLFSKKPLNAQLLKGRITLTAGKVTAIELPESSATPFPPREWPRRSPSQPSSSTSR
jgi:hypothetical protein